MGIRGTGFTEARDVVINKTVDEAMPLDAHKAINYFVEGVEAQYAADPASVTDIAAVATPITGTQKSKLHVFNVTIVKATGTYTFDYVETVPNAESIS